VPLSPGSLGQPNDFGILLPTTMSTQLASRKASDLDPAAYPDSSNSLLGLTPGCANGLVNAACEGRR